MSEIIHSSSRDSAREITRKDEEYRQQIQKESSVEAERHFRALMGENQESFASKIQCSPQEITRKKAAYKDEEYRQQIQKESSVEAERHFRALMGENQKSFASKIQCSPQEITRKKAARKDEERRRQLQKEESSDDAMRRFQALVEVNQEPLLLKVQDATSKSTRFSQPAATEERQDIVQDVTSKSTRFSQPAATEERQDIPSGKTPIFDKNVRNAAMSAEGRIQQMRTDFPYDRSSSAQTRDEVKTRADVKQNDDDKEESEINRDKSKTKEDSQSGAFVANAGVVPVQPSNLSHHGGDSQSDHLKEIQLSQGSSSQTAENSEAVLGLSVLFQVPDRTSEVLPARAPGRAATTTEGKLPSVTHHKNRDDGELLEVFSETVKTASIESDSVHIDLKAEKLPGTSIDIRRLVGDVGGFLVIITTSSKESLARIQAAQKDIYDMFFTEYKPLKLEVKYSGKTEMAVSSSVEEEGILNTREMLVSRERHVNRKVGA